MRLRLFVPAISLLALLSPFTTTAARAADDAPASTKAKRYGTWGIDLAGMDTSVKPGDDFFRYVNGKWVATTQIPPDKTRFGAFDILRDLSEVRVRAILDRWAADKKLRPGSDEAKVAALYRTFLERAAPALEARRRRGRRRDGRGHRPHVRGRILPPDSKAKMEKLVADLRSAMKMRIDKLEWMSPETKAKAQEKLAKFGVKIGYPSKWRDYSKLVVREGDLVGNADRAARFDWAYDVARINKPVDEGEWGMTPQTVNAYYQAAKNEIVFPAAILQPPFFDPNADPAVNYGAIGGVIGHEVTHGFDDQGRKSDGDGVLRDWWATEDATKFEAQATRLGAQYEAVDFPQLPGIHIIARNTMGENIGDLGGILMGLDAYRVSLKGQPAPVIDGFTGEQRVFLGWGQVWRTLVRDDALRQLIMTDSHSPGMVRAVNPLRNIDAWYEAFDVKEGDKNYVKPEERVRIW